MFISTYSTYVGTNASETINKRALRDNKIGKESFSAKFFKAPTLESKTLQNLPINYISSYKNLNSQKRFEQNLQNVVAQTYEKTNAMQNAKTAYTESSKMFSFLNKPSISLDQTPKIDKKLPKDIQDLKEQNKRTTMINTYISNNNYFQITA